MCVCGCARGLFLHVVFSVVVDVCCVVEVKEEDVVYVLSREGGSGVGGWGGKRTQQNTQPTENPFGI